MQCICPAERKVIVRRMKERAALIGLAYTTDSGHYTDAVPSEGLRACSPFQGITLRSPTTHTGCRNGVHRRGACFAFGVERNESIELKEAKSQTRQKTSGRDSPELRVVGISFNPGPDAQDRLRRLFTLILEHAAEKRQVSPPDDNELNRECE